MAMMISKFNKLIQSKMVWYLFLGLVVVAFVLVYIPGFGDSRSASRAQKEAQLAGTLFGEEISRPEFGQVYRNVGFQVALFYMQRGTEMPRDAATEDMLIQNTWQQLAILKKAELAGITVSEKEAADALSKDPLFFGESGAFDPTAYRWIVENVLPRLGFNEAMLTNYYTQQALIQKMSRIPEQSALVTEGEIKSSFHLYFDKRIAEYTSIPRSLSAPVEVTEEMAKEYFESNAPEFQIPEKVSVDYVQFKVSDFIEGIEIDEEALKTAYGNNLQRYMIEPAADAPEGTELEFTPFEEVKEDIRTSLLNVQAQQLALDKADDLVGALSRSGDSFEAVAKNKGVEIVTGTQPFSSMDSVPGIDTTSAFIDVAMLLSDDESNYYSDPVAGTDTIYVIKLNKRIPAQDPAFEDVKDAATEAARFAAEDKAYAESAEAIRTAIEKAISGGASFADAVAEQKLTVQTTEPFSMMEPLSIPFGREIQMAARFAEKGQLCKLVNTSSDSVIAFITEKTAADETTELPTERERLLNELNYRKMAALQNSWREAVLKEANLEDFITAVEEDAEANS